MQVTNRIVSWTGKGAATNRQTQLIGIIEKLKIDLISPEVVR